MVAAGHANRIKWTCCRFQNEHASQARLLALNAESVQA
jgi:hypothetical protein